MVSDDTATVDALLRRWATADRRGRERIRRSLPIAALQNCALHHADPWVRRACVGALDHHAPDESTAVFLSALDDPVAFVREVALHSLACERCRKHEVCAADVVPRVIQTLRRDPDPEVRYKTLTILRGFATRHPAAVEALGRAAHDDPDPVLREGARLALTTALVPSRNDVRRRLGRRARYSRTDE